ncbi:MAG: molybdopterin-dependent oxidoreductase, partial [Gemmatimonadales bacterium]
DEGRASYRWLNHGDRAEAPLVRENGSLVASDWDHALARAAQIVKGSSGQAAVIASPNASNEALYLLATLTGDFDSARAFSVRRVPGEQPLAGVPNLALREERAANASGARLFGFEERFHDVLTVAAEASLVVVLDDPLEGVGGGARNGLGQGMGYFIYIGTTLPQAARDADVVLPIANVAEEDGTFLNRDMRVQRYFQAKTPPGMARPAWWVLGELLAELGKGQALQSAAEVFDTLAQAVGAFSGLDYAMLHTVGAQAADREPAGAGAEAVG